MAIAALMAASAHANVELAKPIEDSFLWVSEETGLNRIGVKGDSAPSDATHVQIGESMKIRSADGTLKIVPIK